MAAEGEAWEQEWQGVDPIPQDDGPRPAVPIAYSPEFQRAMGLFRAALARDERSARSLRLTTRVIALNASNYTAWQFRRVCLKALVQSPRELFDELDYLDSLSEENAKNYQLWHHRRWVAGEIGVERRREAAERELEFSAEQLREGDSKNYHVWSHRQWVLGHLGGATWQDELQFCGELLELDAWNNSAWNQRMFAFKHLRRVGGEGPPKLSHGKEAEGSIAGLDKFLSLSVEEYEREFRYILSAIQRTPANESPWAYLRGFLRLCGRQLGGEHTVVRVCDEIIREGGVQGRGDGQEEDVGVDFGVAWQGPVFALSFLLDVLEAGGDPAQVAKAAGLEALLCGGEDVDPRSVVGAKLCDKLKQMDKMRESYWDVRKRVLPSQ